MKKFLALATMAAALLAAVSCEPGVNGNNDEPKNLEVTAENLAGTWECFVEHDFAQGYEQKYRVTFKGENYTMWHMHQVLYNETGEWGSLTRVGNKYSGTWEYADGTITFTPQKAYASYFQNSIDPPKYTYYLYNTDTMESDPWYETPEYFIEYLDKPEWRVLSFTKDALTVKVNMDTFAMEPKN